MPLPVDVFYKIQCKVHKPTKTLHVLIALIDIYGGTVIVYCIFFNLPSLLLKLILFVLSSKNVFGRDKNICVYKTFEL